MKKGQAASILAIVLVAAVGLFVLVKGVSTTGMAIPMQTTMHDCPKLVGQYQACLEAVQGQFDACIRRSGHEPACEKETTVGQMDCRTLYLRLLQYDFCMDNEPSKGLLRHLRVMHRDVI